MLHHELDGRVKLRRVNQSDKGKDSRKGAGRKHEFHHTEVGVPLKHSALKLARKTVKEEEQKEKHDARPRCSTFIFSQVIVLKAEPQIVGRRHKHGDSHSNHERDNVIVLRVALVPQDLAHEHDRCQFERLEQRRCRKRNVSERLVLAPAGKHVGNGGKRVLIDDNGLAPARFEVQPQDSRHDERPEAIREDQGVRVGEVLSRETRVSTRQHAFLNPSSERDKTKCKRERVLEDSTSAQSPKPKQINILRTCNNPHMTNVILSAMQQKIRRRITCLRLKLSC